MHVVQRAARASHPEVQLPEFGFSRDRRLLNAAEYKRVFDKAQRSSDRCFTILMRPNGGLSPRLGLAISKKQVRRAVDRNRIKRVVRESFRHHTQALEGMDIIVLARRDTATKNNAGLFRSLERHWQQLTNLRDHSRSAKSDH